MAELEASHFDSIGSSTFIVVSDKVVCWWRSDREVVVLLSSLDVACGDSFFWVSLKHTEQSPFLSTLLKKPHPLLQRVGNPCWELESMFWALILTIFNAETMSN